MDSSYKARKEEFVSGSTGGSITRINSVCLTALTTYLLWVILTPHLTRRGSNSSHPTSSPLAEFLLLPVPLLLSLTLFQSHPLLFNLLLLFLSLLALRFLVPPTNGQPPLSPEVGREDGLKRDRELEERRLRPKGWVTVYRAHMMVMTVICILAVDFRVFPREFAKAETWGTSLMDLGVGSFVFSLGMTSALPLLRSKSRPSFVREVWGTTKKSAGVLVLGLIRVAMVKGVDYPEHVTEYGVHWNFFFTLGLLPVLGAALGRLSPRIDFAALALLVTGGHQLLLTFSRLQYWALTAARLDLISMNKEGIVSLPGYLAIYLAGLSSGLYILPPDPNFYHTLHARPRDQSKDAKASLERKRARMWTDDPLKLAGVMGSWAILWWVWYAFFRHLVRIQVSRRLANLPYVLWIAAFNVSFLSCYLAIDLLAKSHTLKRRFADFQPPAAPAIFEAINRNGLVVFLVANLLTGLVNLSMESMYVPDGKATAVLVAYLGAVTAAAWALRNSRLRI